VKIAVVQPNFFPFRAYYDLAQRVDKFIFLDDTIYSGKSWVNKTVFKLSSKKYYFKIPLDYDHKSPTITKNLKSKNENWRKKFKKIIKVQYKNYPNFEIAYPLLNEIINIPTESFSHISAYSVFRISHSIFSSKTKFTFSSINYEHVKQSYWDKILYICKKEKASTFYTLSSTKGFFDEKKFLHNNIKISYFTSYTNQYSIIDELMQNESYKDILEKECNLLQDERKFLEKGTIRVQRAG